jgi:epoxide hydrolase-like predicted phosphatase
MGSEFRGLLVDYGGVLTTNIFDAWGVFCSQEGIERDAMSRLFSSDASCRELVAGLETGQLPEDQFEPAFAAALGVAPAGLIDRLFAGSALDEPMVAAVLAARRAGVRTGLISNSWGTRRYDRALLAELFHGLVISGEVGIRKPAPEIYSMGAEQIGVDPSACVFVDDLPFNLGPAKKLGMATIHHVSSDQTIAELERLLGVALR